MKAKLITLFLAGMIFVTTDSFARRVYVKLEADTQAWSNVVEDSENVVITLPSGSSDFVMYAADQFLPDDEVWVAKGVYENSSTMFLNADNNRTNVIIYGGFEGTETSVDQRVKSDVDGNGLIEPWEFTNVTNFKGQGSAEDPSSNFYMLSMQSGTTIDGVTISDNYYLGQTASGGSIGSSGTVRNSIFRNLVTVNRTDGKNITGGGIYISGGHVEGCLIESCAAIEEVASGQVQGGAVLIYGTSDSNCGVVTPKGYLKNSIIRNCKAEGGSKPMGAAIFYKNGAIIENCVIANNASVKGIGDANGQGVIQGHTKGDGTFEVNRFINCTIVNNVADVYTVFFEAACTEVYNCICWGNTTSSIDYPTQDADYTNNIRWAASGNIKAGTYPYVGPFAYNSFENAMYNSASIQNVFSPVLLSFPLVEGTSEAGGVDPEFVNPTIYPGLAISDVDLEDIRKANWSLKETSPLVNAGINAPDNKGEFVANATLPASFPETDLLGNGRVDNYDLGAYEFGGLSSICTTTEDASCRVFSKGGDLRILGLDAMATVQIYALDGSLVYSTTVDTGDTTLPISLKGCYIVKVQSSNSVYGQKVIF